jgi:branched-chain amino acid transport system permease protein
MDQLLSATSFILLFGVSYGVILFTISVGLTVTMGLMRVVNLAHTAFAAIGGYIAVSLMVDRALPFSIALLAAIGVSVILSFVVERLVYKHLYKASELDQVLMTLGLIFLCVASLNLFFGPNTITAPLPSSLAGDVNLLGRNVPVYRLFVIGAGAFLVLGLWVLIDKTSFGARLRAAVDNQSMAQATGIDVNWMFSISFALGSALAAFGGAVGYAILPMEPMYPFKYLTLVLIVVTISGFDNIRKSALAAILVGIIDTAGRYLFPAFGGFLVYLILLGTVVWRDRLMLLGRVH